MQTSCGVPQKRHSRQAEHAGGAADAAACQTEGILAQCKGKVGRPGDVHVLEALAVTCGVLFVSDPLYPPLWVHVQQLPVKACLHIPDLHSVCTIDRCHSEYDPSTVMAHGPLCKQHGIPSQWKTCASEARYGTQ